MVDSCLQCHVPAREQERSCVPHMAYGGASLQRVANRTKLETVNLSSGRVIHLGIFFQQKYNVVQNSELSLARGLMKKCYCSMSMAPSLEHDALSLKFSDFDLGERARSEQQYAQAASRQPHCDTDGL